MRQNKSTAQSAGDTTTAKLASSEAVNALKAQVARLQDEKSALARDVEDSKREWSNEHEKASQLERDMTQLLNSQQQSAEVMATANSQSRELQVKLDSALLKLNEQNKMNMQLREAVEVQRESAEEARIELDRVTHQTSLQIGASQQVLQDLRSHIVTVEQERDAIEARLNQVRVTTKDGHLMLEADLRDARCKVKELQQQVLAEKTKMQQRREAAKTKFNELVSRAEESETKLEETRASHATLDNSNMDLRVMLQKLEIDLRSAQSERDVLLHERKTQTNSQEDDRARLIETLEKTEIELKDQRTKRMVAKNEILSMVRQLDGQRDVMSELFGQLQKVVTRVGTYVITCRSAESKCNDTLSLLDVDMEIEVTSVSGGGVRVAVEGEEEEDGEGGRKRSGSTGGDKRRRRGRSSGSRKTPRNPTDLVAVLDNELHVMGDIVDEVTKKVELLNRHFQNGGAMRHGGMEMSTGNGSRSGGGSGGEGCAGYVKRMLGMTEGREERTTVHMNGKRRKNVRRYGKLGEDEEEEDVIDEV